MWLVLDDIVKDLEASACQATRDLMAAELFLGSYHDLDINVGEVRGKEA